MNKTELIKHLSTTCGLPTYTVSNVLNELRNIIKENVNNNKDIEIRGLCKFYAFHAKATTAYNFKTKERIDVPESIKIKCKVSQTLLEENK